MVPGTEDKDSMLAKMNDKAHLERKRIAKEWPRAVQYNRFSKRRNGCGEIPKYRMESRFGIEPDHGSDQKRLRTHGNHS